MEPIRISADMQLPYGVKILSSIFTDAGYELYVVGGAVRDHLSGVPIKDFDLVTNALPESIDSILKYEGIASLGIGEQFGIIQAIFKEEGEEYEIATFREDSLTSDGRRPDFVTFSDIETDVNRRDLTINALFYDIDKEEIVDYVGGLEDIKNGVIRTVGEAKQRFAEDKLRILRAIRFAHRIGGEVDPEIHAFLTSGYDLEEISYERIRDEFSKSVMSAKSVKRLLTTYTIYDMFKWILPGLDINHEFNNSHDFILVLTTLLIKNDVSKLKRVLNALTYTTKQIREVQFLIGLTTLMPSHVPTLKKAQNLTDLTDDQIREFGRINNINYHLLETFLEFELSIKGKDVMERYNVTGPELGIMIETLEVENFNFYYEN